jgi:hypothetical protein
MAGGPGKIHEHPKSNTNGFRQNPKNIGDGRKKKIYTVLKEKGYSADDIRTAFGEIAYYDEQELEEVIGDTSKPIITRIVANQFKTAFYKGDWNKIKEILEHTIGKPDQNINASGDFTGYHVITEFKRPDGEGD